MDVVSGAYYTIDNSSLYVKVDVKYRGSEYLKGKVTLYYRYGTSKGIPLETKNYKLYYENISHWQRYYPSED